MRLQKLRIIIGCLVASAIAVGIVPCRAQATASSDVDRWMRDVKFQFVPDPVQSEEGGTATVLGYFEYTPGFPLWLMMDMGGALVVDEEHFSINSSEKDADGVWMMDLSCMDSVNGFFNLHLAVDSQSGEAALKVATMQDGDIALYQGKVGAYDGPGMPDFRNEKRTEGAMLRAAELDTLVPSMNFQVKLNSELYGPKSQVNILPNLVRLWDPRQFRVGDYSVICCEKQNGTWYVRLQLVEGTEVSEAMYLDLAIDSWTGEVNYRRGFADQLRANWRTIVDGEVSGRPDAAVMTDRAKKR